MVRWEKGVGGVGDFKIIEIFIFYLEISIEKSKVKNLNLPSLKRFLKATEHRFLNENLTTSSIWEINIK